MSKEIVILGAGYAGVLTALTARKYLSADEAKITVVNQFPTHQIITELHRLAGGTIAEGAVALPLKKIFKGLDIDLQIAKVTKFNVDTKKVDLDTGYTLSYDTLVVSLGSQTGFFGIPGLEENSMVLKSVNDANKINRHIEDRIKAYAQSKDEADATIVIGGGGLTGVELVGEIVDNFPKIAAQHGVNFADLKIKLVEAGPKILPVLPDVLIERATESLTKRGVEFITGTPVTGVDGNVISLKDRESIVANTFIWTGGVAALPIVAESGLAADRGKATINEFLQSTSHEDVFVIGDASVALPADGGRPLYAPTAQVAWQMGECAGYNLFAQYKNQEMKTFSAVNSGTLASLGRKDAVATIGASNTQLKGLPATLMKEASNIRYLTHIKALFGLAY
ncbi:NAD(P)/FAD-dependent oxidoreductase [Lysinibacillus sphaericus]|uniref:FAD-dependent oxidoreductase n=3 Tax=Lysinibacillus TaxID=400634 RepID=A0A2S5D5U5_LYSSH|nr:MULTISPECIES: NAD(P)/FAD-dependent oxidoreductase [Lysinibacillus]AHN20241.1 pyridine nucleotide-disulfide oxidoreductase [Lysinibacillus varians]AVK98719.1 FAD-dependent oxidoreductase [Lysinibacillus sphaericus]MCS1384742.1 NAD(P)/FAD-dependent oxidoreductase [Lysinibacillus sphaericus]MED4544364.1 NAD(P)/FAD-dependent oxidoreductase [Lysinibacillus sphaericus]POZ58368.1 NADH dehydrogenase-like protein YjlD [Lysinibacillus sphaericus]